MVQTSALLPAARIDVFSNEDLTHDLVKSLDDDWRFARVIFGAQRANLADAVDFYGSHQSPNIIIIQTDDTSEGFIASLADLAAVCSEDTECLVIGPENDIQLYRRLTGMGVSDYLVHPVETEDMVSALAKILLARLGQSDSHLISVVGAKGGVGVTNISQLLATSLAKGAKQKLLMMDTSSAWSDLALSVGHEAGVSLREVYQSIERKDEDSLTRMILSVDQKLSVLACGAGELLSKGISDSELEAIVDYMMQQYPYVLMDLSKSDSHIKRPMMTRSHVIFIVTTPTLYSLRMAKAMINEYREISDEDSLTKIKIVMNMQGRSATNEISAKDLKAMLGAHADIVIPYEPKVFMGAEASGNLLCESSLGEALQGKFVAALDDVLDGSLAIDSPSKKGSFLSKIKTSLSKS